MVDGMHDTGERWRLGHRPALDGLRGVAIAMVLLTHSAVPGAGEFGAVGVTVFFTLSGFLITSLLLEELEEQGSIRIARFYWRRFWRLAPALAACVLLALGVELLARGRVADWSLAAGAATWTGNFVMLGTGWNGWAETPLSHTWSLAIEEQFYLVWPLVLVFAATKLPRRWLPLVVGYLTAGSVLIAVTVGFEHRYLMLDARASQLLLGALLALLLTGSRRGVRVPAWVGHAALLLTVVVAAFMLGSGARDVLVAVLTVGVLASAATGRMGWLGASSLRWVGLRAYGIYLYHRPMGYLVAFLAPGLAWWAAGLVMVALTLVVAAASYRWLEEPARAWGRARQGMMYRRNRAPRMSSVTPV